MTLKNTEKTFDVSLGDTEARSEGASINILTSFMDSSQVYGPDLDPSDAFEFKAMATDMEDMQWDVSVELPNTFSPTEHLEANFEKIDESSFEPEPDHAEIGGGGDFIMVDLVGAP
ncbi:MAG: hypothetical protein ABJJ69_15530 [Paracoccaceae bacterium]